MNICWFKFARITETERRKMHLMTLLSSHLPVKEKGYWYIPCIYTTRYDLCPRILSFSHFFNRKKMNANVSACACVFVTNIFDKQTWHTHSSLDNIIDHNERRLLSEANDYFSINIRNKDGRERERERKKPEEIISINDVKASKLSAISSSIT